MGDEGYKIKSKRFYRDGTEELVTEPISGDFIIVPQTPVEAKVLELLRQGRTDEAMKMSYKLAVACIKSGTINTRDCRVCFFRHYCALPKNPVWFERKLGFKPRRKFL